MQDSDIFKNKFIYKFEILESKLYRKKVKINFEEKEIILDQNNKYIINKKEILKNKYLNITSIEGDICFCLNRNRSK